jgi:hypothetical protein
MPECNRSDCRVRQYGATLWMHGSAGAATNSPVSLQIDGKISHSFRHADFA